MELTKYIIDRCKKRDRKAQQALYRLYSAKMYAICLRYYPNADIACDILQDGFIKVYEKINSFRFDGSFEGWIRKIMVNTALEYHRKTKDGLEVDISTTNSPLNSNEIVQNTDYQFILKLVANLPQQYRLVFNLYEIEGYSHAEIAAKLNISISTSKSNYCRAKAILRDKLKMIEKFERYAIIRARAI